MNLTVIEGPEKGKSFTFTEPDNFLLGRSAEGSRAHLRLSPDDTYVSRNHFLLGINPPDCFIRDAGSLNAMTLYSKSLAGDNRISMKMSLLNLFCLQVLKAIERKELEYENNER